MWSFCCITSLIIKFAGPLTVILFLMVIISRWLSSKKPNILRTAEECFFITSPNGSKEKFPDLIEKAKQPKESTFEPSIYLSVVIPAYNEQSRLPSMLNSTIEYLESRQQNDKKFSYEIIIVDDGSKDDTYKIALDYTYKYGSDKLRLLRCSHNRGKGGAVQLGVLSARGEFILFADADGATQFMDVKKLETFIQNAQDPQCSIAIGSRSHLQEEAIATRSMFRTLLMYGFHFVVWAFTVRSVRDTQCGFKLMGGQLARHAFNWLHVQGWAFDVELLLLCEHLKVTVGEIPVCWTEIEGSKIVPVFSWLAMGRDVLKISAMYMTGSWQLPPPIKKRD